MNWEPCGLTLSQGGTCARPAGHSDWRLDVGWPHNSVSAYAHSATPQDYDAEVWPYMAVAHGSN